MTPREWTEEEIAEKLDGYLEVPKSNWEQIQHGTHMRYMTKEKGFRTGGFVQKNPFDTIPTGSTEQKRFVKMQSGYGTGSATWVVAYEDLDKVFIKPDASTMILLGMLTTAVAGLNENVTRLAERIKRLERGTSSHSSRR